MMRITDTVKHLIIINIIFYVGCLIIGEGAFRLFSMHLPLNPDFKFWQPLTYMFMHSPFTIKHILFNMFGLWMFGSALEDMWGSKKFLFFYISCGLGAVALHIGIDYYLFSKAMAIIESAGISGEQVLNALNTKNLDVFQGKITQAEFDMIAGRYYGTMLGASGAIYGIMVAYAFLFPDREMLLFLLPIPIKVKYFVSFIIITDLFLGFKGLSIFAQNTGGVAHFAHIGGALIGYIMMWYWKKNEFNNRRWN